VPLKHAHDIAQCTQRRRAHSTVKKAGAGKGAFYIDGYPYSSFNLPLLWRKKIAFSFGIYEPFITVPYNINLLQ
jgi:hypothetical protein